MDKKEIVLTDEMLLYLIIYKPLIKYVESKFNKIEQYEVSNIIKCIFQNNIHIKNDDISKRDKFVEDNKKLFTLKDKIFEVRDIVLRELQKDMKDILNNIDQNDVIYQSYLLRQETITLVQLYYKKEISQDDLTEHISGEFLKLYTLYTIKDDNKSECWVYEKGICVPNGITTITQFCRILLGPHFKSRLYVPVVDKLKNDTYIEHTEFFINEHINLIPMLNGIYNLKTEKLVPFNSKYKFFNKIPIKYNKTKKCPVIEQFLKDILLEGDIKTVEEMIGYTLYRDYPIEKAFMFTGEGSNGKSKLLELLKHLLGINNVCNISLSDLENKPFTLSHFLNKMANLGADIGNTTLKDTSIFKSITCRDLITSDRKFKSQIEFNNYAKQYFSANKIPVTTDITDGFMRRWEIIAFKIHFVTPDEYKQIEDKSNLKLVDINIINKLTASDELSGLFNLAIKALHRLLKQNEFTKSTSTEDTRKTWLRMSSSLNGFIMDRVKTQQYGAFLSKQEFKRLYYKYCQEFKVYPVSDKQIKNKLTIECGASETRPYINNVQTYCWSDIDVEGADMHSENKEETQDFGIQKGLIIDKEEQ